MPSCLLLIDIQNDYFENGNNPLVGSLEAAGKAQNLLSYFRGNGLPVCHIQHLNLKPTSTYLVPNTTGCEIHELVRPRVDETVIQKHFPNSFRDTSLMAFLKSKSIDKVVIAGMMTHMCIDATTRVAFDFGFGCTVIADACATKNLEIAGTVLPSDDVHNSFLAALKAYYASVISADEFTKQMS